LFCKKGKEKKYLTLKTICRFLCDDTVEKRIQDLQKKKLDLAEGVLTGAKRSGANKLTFDDLKMLFNMDKK